ncbi:MAG: phospho-sugar mutase [Chthoniobacteraceae bacterium]
MTELRTTIARAVTDGHLLTEAAENLAQMLDRSSDPVVASAIQELAQQGAWGELNDRFFKTLAFGTGGLRGRTIGKIVTASEQGAPQPLGRPEFACVGTNAMNGFNISRATQGLVAYLKDWFANEGRTGRPKLVIAHDTRHFSRDFAELTARVATENGCDGALFEGPRSTPQLSFAVRHLHADAGVVITASHNPSHDNGYKVYFNEGAQVVEPHASGIIAKVNAIASDVYTPVPANERGEIETLGQALDDAYMARLETLLLDRPMVDAAAKAGLKIVFTSIHGTGGIISLPMLKKLGFQCLTVPEQEQMDGRFPSVNSPNPENAEALSLAIELAKKEGADLVIATDPDADRMGVAVRNRAGEMELLTGNQIGSVMAAYRVRKLVEQGVITPENAARCVIIKTLVTTDLQKAIAEAHGLRCVETLTGFKYIGAKLGAYERATGLTSEEYRGLPEAETRKLRLEKSSFYVCGGEESYGYSAADFVRDKDANGSAVVFAEVAAYAKSRGLTVIEYLDETFAEYGFYLEKNGNLTFEGAEGADKISRLVASYGIKAPKELGGIAVTSARNFATEEITDVEGDELPKEKMLMFELADGRRIAVRPSGTEPKIKFYLFAKRSPAEGGKFEMSELPAIRDEVGTALDALWTSVQSDVAKRLA